MKRKLFFSLTRQVTRRCTINRYPQRIGWNFTRSFCAKPPESEEDKQGVPDSRLPSHPFKAENLEARNETAEPKTQPVETTQEDHQRDHKQEETSSETAESSENKDAEKPRGKWVSRLASIGGGAYLLSKTGKLLGLLKFTKIGPLFSMMASTLAYSWVFGWPYAVGMISLLFIHESGHAFAMRRLGINVGPMVFIPFMGAAVVMKDMPKNAMDEAIVAYAGPLIGTLGTLPFLAYGMTTGSQLAFALANFGFIINCFNLIPFGSLDGGRIAPCISKWLYPLGLAGMAYVCFYHNVSPLLYLIFFAGLYETYQRFTGGRELPPGFMNISGTQRILVSAAYFGLIAALMYLLRINESRMKSVDELKRAEKVLFFGGTDEENNLRVFFNAKGTDVDDLPIAYASVLFEGSSFQMDRGFHRFEKENPFQESIRFAFYEEGLGQIKTGGRELTKEEKEVWVQIYAELSQTEVQRVQETEYNPQLGQFFSFLHEDGSGSMLENETEDMLYSFPNWDEYIFDSLRR